MGTDYRVEGFNPRSKSWEELSPRGPIGWCRGFVAGVRKYEPLPAVRLVALADGAFSEVVEMWDATASRYTSAGRVAVAAHQAVNEIDDVVDDLLRREAEVERREAELERRLAEVSDG